MSRRHPSQHKGGRLPGGSPNKASSPKRNAGIGLTTELNDKLKNLAEREGWNKSYLVEQILRNYLEMPADYTWSDLQLLRLGLLE